MKIVIDVNLPPRCVEVLQRHSIDSVHWTTVGDPRATDREIMAWARDHAHVVFTHDLDFGALLAMTHATGPSVIQVRTQDVFPEAIEAVVVKVLTDYRDALQRGAIISVDQVLARVRILPIQP